MFGLGLTEFIVLGIIALIMGVYLIPLIFFLMTLQKCLKRCSPQSRTMAPGKVWLMLIPLFNFVWQFNIVFQVASTLENEFRLRNMEREAAPGQSIGLACCILIICGIIPVVGIFAEIAGLVCWIVYWIKISTYSKDIASPYAAVAIG